ncbi:MAG: glycoside hydrolase family 99-like domain-containing protein, partial [Chitinophagaceae bacterium]
FCLCWANENWTRRWDGDEHEILLKQEYNIDDDRNHMKHLCSAFRDPRYIRIDGKPVFSVYRTMLLPNIRKTVETWRETARKEGIGEIYLCRMESISQKIDPVSIGFDAAIEFQPDLESLQARNWGSLFKRALNKVKIKRSPFLKNMVYEYSEVVKNMIAKSPTNYKLYPGITPGWDNSARRQEGALIFNNSTPELYESWLNNIVKSFRPFSTDENFIFINAWNEWAEGNHLEPCKRWGTSYLEATKRVVEIYNSNNA